MKRKRARPRRAWWLLAALAVAIACDRPEYSYSPDIPVIGGVGAIGNFPSSGGSSVVTTAGTTSVGGSSLPQACTVDSPVASPTFSKQVVSNQLPARQDLYVQLTDDELVAFKRSGNLLPDAPSTPATASPLSNLLGQLLSSASDLRRPLVQELINRFKVTRATWPNPWTLRLVDHVGSEHMNPVRIHLKDDAWIARIVDGTLAIVDVKNAIVSVTAATAAPQRIAAIYYTTDDRIPGAVASCDTGKRELALGNEAMVESYSLGTTDILNRMNSDIAALEALFMVSRPCALVDKGGVSFRSYTVCQTWRFFDASTEYLAYQWALSNPSDLYKPTSQNLATLIEALKNDRFEPDPFVGAPGTGFSGGAGAGGDGGGGGAADAGQGGVAQGGATL
jgi:hypothetical protein